MYKAGQYLSKSTLLNLHYPYNYGLVYWSQLLPNPILIASQHIKLIRILNFSHYLAHTSPLFHSMEVLPFKNIYYHRIGLMMYKFNNNLLPNCLLQLYRRTDSVHDHSTGMVSHRGHNCICSALTILDSALTILDSALTILDSALTS